MFETMMVNFQFGEHVRNRYSYIAGWIVKCTYIAKVQFGKNRAKGFKFYIVFGVAV